MQNPVIDDKHEFRPMQADDLPAIAAIQSACYGMDIVETPDILRQRLQSAGDTCWVAELQGKVLAYLVGYRSLLGKVTPLHGEFEPARQADTLYLHDLAVHPQAAGKRLGPSLVDTLLSLAHQEKLPYSALVSVQNSYEFWKDLGYEDFVLTDEEQIARLGTYGGTPHYMFRAL